MWKNVWFYSTFELRWKKLICQWWKRRISIRTIISSKKNLKRGSQISKTLLINSKEILRWDIKTGSRWLPSLLNPTPTHTPKKKKTANVVKLRLIELYLQDLKQTLCTTKAGIQFMQNKFHEEIQNIGRYIGSKCFIPCNLDAILHFKRLFWVSSSLGFLELSQFSI